MFVKYKQRASVTIKLILLLEAVFVVNKLIHRFSDGLKMYKLEAKLFPTKMINNAKQVRFRHSYLLFGNLRHKYQQQIDSKNAKTNSVR